jgi:hypothetical protein
MGGLSDLLETVSRNDDNSSQLTSLLISVSPDTAFAYAIEGLIDFKKNRFSQAKINFLKSIELDPGFTEVKKYLVFISEPIHTDEQINLDERKVNAEPKSSSAAKKK